MMCTLLFMGLWQIHYLKRYFQTKKIIWVASAFC